MCHEFSSFCEVVPHIVINTQQHQALHEVKQKINECGSMKAVHVGLECSDDHEVHCDVDGPCVVIHHEHTKEAAGDDMPTEDI